MAVIVINLNRRYKLSVVLVYARTSSHEDQIAESFYEDVDSAVGKVKAQ